MPQDAPPAPDAHGGDPSEDTCAERLARLETHLLARQQRTLETLAGGVAHEFNNLMTGIVGYSQMALDPAASPELHERAHNACLRAARRGREVVVRLARFAGVEQPVDGKENLRVLLEDLLTLLRTPLQQRRIVLETAIEGEGTVRLPSEQLHSVMLEILQNAMDALENVHPEARRLSVSLSFEETEAIIEIADTGPGMPPEVRERLGEPFFTTRGALGLGTDPAAKGLGVACVAAVVRRAGGRFEVESGEESGTRVRLVLPRRPGADGARVPRILVVDDEPNIRRMFRRFLEKDGFEILDAEDGEAALDHLARGSVDLVLLDQMMPRLSGLDLLERLHATDAPTAPPVVMITAAYSPDLARRALSLGAAACTSKPVNRRKIAFLAEMHARTPHGPWSLPDARPAAPSERPADGPADHVLVVEADGLVRDVLDLVLTRGGYRATPVATGAAALAATEREYYDLILLDTVLQDACGEEVVRQVRLNNPYTPILIHTSSLGDDTVRELRAAGATLAVSKTVEVEHLLAEVDTLIRIFREENADG